jgi:arylsulfatase A-like enzyme
MGNYFRAAGYDTKYIGKWHISHEDIVDDTGYIPPTVSRNKGRDEKTRERYLDKDPLAKFGFPGWLGADHVQLPFVYLFIYLFVYLFVYLTLTRSGATWSRRHQLWLEP